MIKISVNKPLLLKDIMGNTRANINRSLRMSGKLVKFNIKKELRSPNKTGVEKKNIRSRVSPLRRSAIGESLARDTGASERLIASNLQGESLIVGFKPNPFGFDYVAFHEEENNRPTMKKAVENSLRGIDYIFDKNLKPKK